MICLLPGVDFWSTVEGQLEGKWSQLGAIIGMLSDSSKVVIFRVVDHTEAHVTFSIEKGFGFGLTDPKLVQHQVGLVTENLHNLLRRPKSGRKKSRSQKSRPYFLRFSFTFVD